MFQEYQDAQLVLHDGDYYLVWREYEDKNSDYLAVALPTVVADDDLIEAYFKVKYPPLEED